jgi:hypothetical protein
MQTDNASAVVTQEDREAAADEVLARGLPRTLADAIKRGERDDHHTVQAFARHRLASQSESTARIEALEKALQWALAEIDGQNLYTGGVDFTPDEQRNNAFDRAAAALHVEGAGS